MFAFFAQYSGISFLNYVSILLAVVMYAFVMSKFVRAYRVVGEVAVAPF
ncbi:MAG: hypothetical protein MUQ56_05585 [Thermoleophilia bacterium]|nr:hypothetical protein [Thermoleophilia bacterium]